MSSRRSLAPPVTVLLVIHGTCVLGGFLAPNSYLTQNRALPWAPPSAIHFLDTNGTLHLRPFVYPLRPDLGSTDTYSEDTSSRLPLQFFVRGDSYRLAGLFTTDLHFLGLEAPYRVYLLGTDGTGRDVLARTLQGGATSLLAGLLAAVLALAIGTTLGLFAGYLGGKPDSAFMRATELFLALPWLYLLLSVRAFFPLDLSPGQASLAIACLLAALGWPASARLVRGQVLSSKQRDYVEAARAAGVGEHRIVGRHILPQLLAVVKTQATILIPACILAEVTLTFLGLGLQEPQASWGSQLASLQQFYVLSAHWWILAPLPVMVLTFVAYYSIANATKRYGASSRTLQTSEKEA